MMPSLADIRRRTVWKRRGRSYRIILGPEKFWTGFSLPLRVCFRSNNPLRVKTVSARDGLNEFDPHIQGTLTMAKLFGLFLIVLAIGCQPQDAPKTAVPRDAWDPPKGTAPAAGADKSAADAKNAAETTK